MVVANQLEAWDDRRIASAPLHVRTVIALAVLYVDVSDAVMVLTLIGDSIVVAGREVADVEANHEILRHIEQPLKAGGRSDFVGIVHVGVGVE